MVNRSQRPQNHLPIAAEDLVKLGIKSQLIPFIVSAAQWVERSPNDSLSPVENLVEILDAIVSSTAVDRLLKIRCFKILRKFSSSHGILPRSYRLEETALSDITLCTSGELVKIRKGRWDGNWVRMKAFQTQAVDYGKVAVDPVETKQRIYREIMAWKYVLHPNVLPFLGVSETFDSFCIINPWLSNGNIVEYTKKNQRASRLQLLAQAACGLKYLHSLSIVHGSLAPGTVLITDDGTACLGDFGITSIMGDTAIPGPDFEGRVQPGVIRYMAPELLDSSQLPRPDCTKESDVYSFVMTAYEALTEILPYRNARSDNIALRIMTGERPPRPSHSRWLKDQTWRMITACWSHKPRRRWNVHGVYSLFLDLSIQEIVEVERDIEIIVQKWNIVAGVPSGGPPPAPFLQEISTRVNDQSSQALINTLLEQGRIPFDDQPGVLNTLGKMCSRFKMIPDSIRIENRVESIVGRGYDGGNSTVSQGKYHGRSVAIKTLRLYTSSNFEECLSKFRREVIAWRHLQHPNILPFIGVNMERNRLAIVSEWMDHGDINEFIKNNQGANRIQLLVDVATGLEYMHSIDMVHGDLKGANILINQSCRACLADFGLSTIAGVDRHAADNTSLTSAVSKTSLMSFTEGGTTRWMSPELLDPERFEITECRPTKQSDCYALGMVIYEVLCGNVPFWGITNIGGVMNAIMTGDRPQKPEGAEYLGFTQELWMVVERCWFVDAGERPGVREVLFRLNRATWSWNRKRLI